MPLGHPETRIQEYWDWAAVALFLLLSIDLLTSIFAASVVGLEHEGNPFMAWLLFQPLPLLIGVHLVVMGLAVLGFWLLFREIERSEGIAGRILRFLTELYLGLLIAVGLFVYANNLAVLVLGRSLV